jgi:2-haloalkanoic acid dehalogenase type II
VAHEERGDVGARPGPRQPARGSRRAVVFDLLTALLDSWSLWDRIAGRAARLRYLGLTAAAGPYRSYEELIAAAIGDPSVAAELLYHWDELAPWPEAPDVLRELRARGMLLGVTTNCSAALAARAAARVGVPLDAVADAETAGVYKPRPEPYRLALDTLGVQPAQTLFVAGSPLDLEGAAAVGLDVVWHNRAGLDRGDAPAPRAELRTLLDLLDL